MYSTRFLCRGMNNVKFIVAAQTDVKCLWTRPKELTRTVTFELRQNNTRVKIKAWDDIESCKIHTILFVLYSRPDWKIQWFEGCDWRLENSYKRKCSKCEITECEVVWKLIISFSRNKFLNELFGRSSLIEFCNEANSNIPVTFWNSIAKKSRRYTFFLLFWERRSRENMQPKNLYIFAPPGSTLLYRKVAQLVHLRWALRTVTQKE